MAKRKVRGALERIDRRNLIYFIMYSYVKIIFNQYYRRVEVRGLENIPRDVPVIFAPNHQNALMDALIVLYSSPGDTVFLARADLFRKRFLSYILNSLKMLPVFRIRDGVEELGKNQQIFDITVGVLHRNHQLCLMPEGNHGGQKKLRRLVKGIFRIAFKAQEPKGDVPYVKIIPVGLEFGDYVKHYHDLQVVYGKPIEVSEYWAEHEENAPRGVNMLKQRLEEEMKDLMIHVETDDYYEMVVDLRKIMNSYFKEVLGIEGRKQYDGFMADKEMIARIEKVIVEDEEKVKPLQEKVKKYGAELKRMNLRNWVIEKKGYSFGKSLWRYFTLLLTLPIYVYGIVNNALLYWLPKRMVRGIKDIQFHSSMKLGFALMIIVPLSYGIQTGLVAIFTDGWYYWLGYLLTLYPMGRLAIMWCERFKKTYHGARYGLAFRKNKKEALAIAALHDEIVEEVKGISNNE